jgi:ATP-dependent exoDNAse (exonuclease V) beta subunit
MSDAGRARASAAERLAADGRARDAAQRGFEGCLVLEAGAGTGKTTVLVSRAVAWGLGPGWERAEPEVADADPLRVARRVLSGVVAITFTEAAAAEMALRIGSALRELESGALPLGCPAAALPPEPRRRLRARALLAALDALVVQSIHAFCRRLLAAHPLEAGLHPRFEVDGDGAGQRRIVRELLRERTAEAFARDGGGDLAQLCLLEPGGAAALEEVLLELLEQGVPPELFEAEVHGTERIARLLAELVGALERLIEAEGGRTASLPSNQIAHTVREAAAVHLAAAEAAQPTADALAGLAGRLPELWSKSALTLLARWARGDFGRREDAAFGSAAPEVRAAAAALVPLLRHLSRLDPARVERARRVVAGLLREAHAGLRREGLVPFATLLFAARGLLRDHPEVAAAERRRIDQLLVDEFQDTDPIQCEIIARLALEGAPAERPGLFLVGDPKQSIYGWRSADLAAYHQFLRRVLGSEEPLRLSVNRRSPAEILDEVECAVAGVMRAEEGVQPRFEPLAADPDRQDPTPAAPVEAWAIFDPQGGGASATELRRLEADALARDLVRLYREELVQEDGPRWGRCAVLVRAASRLDDYLEALRRAGVPYAVDSDRSYYRRREVLDAAALVRAIVDPSDSLALVAFLRSAWVGVPDAAWIPLWGRGLPKLAAELHGADEARLGALATLVREVARGLPDGIPGLARIRGFEESLVAALYALADLRAAFDEDAPDRFVERLRRTVLAEASEAARYLGAHRVANLERFLRELGAQLEEGLADGASLARQLREAGEREPDPFEGPPRSPEGDAVRVMTVHRAKGLDFDHVYLLGIQREPRGRGRLLSAARPEEPQEYELFGAATPGFHALEALRARKGRAEEVRTLYVALTRARRRLVVSGAWPATVRDLESAGSFAELLAHRRGGLPDLAAEVAQARAEGRTEQTLDGVRWRFPALETAPRPAAPAPHSAEGDADAEALAASSARLAVLGREARIREERPRARGAAAEKDAERAEAAFEDRMGAPESSAAERPGRNAALALGSAVHAALEELDLAQPPAAAAARAEEALARTLRAELGAGAARPLASGRQLLRGFFAGPLYPRLRCLGDRLLARELPVLLEPEADDPAAPVAFWSGAIDLLYLDPERGEAVVADYKTDRVQPGRAGELAARYRAQGAVYVRAVQRALGLERPPRFELWLLASGEVVPVPLAEGPAGG